LANPEQSELGAVINLRGLKERLALLLSEVDPVVLHEPLKLLADLPFGVRDGLLNQILESSHLPVSGTSQYVIGVRFRFPGGADELLAALSAHKGRGEFVTHGSISPVFHVGVTSGAPAGSDPL
jgi:hypothetical protein